MQIKATILMSIGLFLISLPVFAGPPADAGVTRTPIEGVDNWGYTGAPSSAPRITCPGGELSDNPFPCSDSMTDRVHLRDGAGWSCMTSNDPRMTGVGVYTSNGNIDGDANGPFWGEFKIVPMEGCVKDFDYTVAYEDLVKDTAIFWYGTWNGRRQFDSDKKAWVSEIKFHSKGVGEGLDGLHFKGTMWITTYTPFPMPYEALYLYYPDLFNVPEATFIGTIQE